jgi:hypothetical protein
MEALTEFSPATPIPLQFDVQDRIKRLRGYLDPSKPDYQPEGQHVNIRAAIKLYQDRKINGLERVYIVDGKVVSEDEAFEGSSWIWCEGIAHQFAEKEAYGHGPFGIDPNISRQFISLFCALTSLLPSSRGIGDSDAAVG